jgi:hypothetical protein
MRRTHVIERLYFAGFWPVTPATSIIQFNINNSLGIFLGSVKYATYNLWLNMALFRGFGIFCQPTCALPNDLLSIHA